MPARPTGKSPGSFQSSARALLAKAAPIHPARRNQIRQRLQGDLPCPDPAAKINRFSFPEIIASFRLSRLDEEGRTRRHDTWSAGSGGRGQRCARGEPQGVLVSGWQRATRTMPPAYGKIAWSRRPEAGAKPCGDALFPTGRAHQRSARRRWQQSSSHRGDRDISRRPTAQGRPGAPGCLCMLVCGISCATLHTRPRVPPRTRSSLRPLSIQRERSSAKLGQNMPREGEGASVV